MLFLFYFFQFFLILLIDIPKDPRHRLSFDLKFFKVELHLSQALEHSCNWYASIIGELHTYHSTMDVSFFWPIVKSILQQWLVQLNNIFDPLLYISKFFAYLSRYVLHFFTFAIKCIKPHWIKSKNASFFNVSQFFCILAAISVVLKHLHFIITYNIVRRYSSAHGKQETIKNLLHPTIKFR